MKIYDITAPISAETAPYPGDPATEIVPHYRISAGDPCNVHRVTLSSHAGTHLDAPLHYLDGGLPVDRIPPERLLGEALVVEFHGIQRIGPQDLEPLELGDRILLLKTRPGPPPQAFDPGHPYLTEPAAHLLVRRGVRLVGIDTPSVEHYGGDGSVHRHLLGAGVVILEGADLSAVPPGSYDFVCLPLPLAGCDGSPARAILIDRREENFDPHTTRWPLS
jgi:arylformamidase